MADEIFFPSITVLLCADLNKKDESDMMVEFKTREQYQVFFAILMLSKTTMYDLDHLNHTNNKNYKNG